MAIKATFVNCFCSYKYSILKYWDIRHFQAISISFCLRVSICCSNLAGIKYQGSSWETRLVTECQLIFKHAVLYNILALDKLYSQTQTLDPCQLQPRISRLFSDHKHWKQGLTQGNWKIAKMAKIPKPVADFAEFFHNKAALQKIFMPGVHDFCSLTACAHEKTIFLL